MSHAVRGLELLVILLMGVVVGVVLAEVIARGLFSTSLLIADELSRSLMIWVALLGAALLVREDGHVRIAMIDGLLAPRWRLPIYLVQQVVTIAFLLIVIVSTLSSWHRFVEQGTVTLGFSIAWVYAALPVTSALMILFAVLNLWRRIAENEY